MQDYKPLGSTATTTVKQAVLDHEDNINAIRSSNSGSAFPTENLVVGMVCYRSDLKEMYQYNGTSWDKVPYAKEIAEGVNTKSLTVSGETSVPTPSVENNSQTIANTQFVHGAINKLVNGAPAALDTLQELSAALGDDPNFSTTVLNKIAEKESKTDADIEHQSIRTEMATLAKKSELPTKVSQLSNDSGYLTGSSAIDESQIRVAPVSTYSNYVSNLSRPLVAESRANYFAFLPADQIIIEQTIDGGKTWTDAGVSDTAKRVLFSGVVGNNVLLPHIDGKMNSLCGIRITFTAMKYDVPTGTAETEKYNYWNSNYVKSAERYCDLDGIWLTISSSSEYMSCKIEKASGSNSTLWYNILETTKLNGWSGQDILRFNRSVFGGGVSQASQYWNYRLTFMTVYTDGTAPNPKYATQNQYVSRIKGFGINIWVNNNPMMRLDLPCYLNENQDATFPASVDAKVLKQGGISLADVYATIAEVNGKVDKVSGKSLSSNDYTTAEKTKLDGIAEGATKVLVDTTFSGTSDNPASSKALSTVLKSQYKDLKTYTDDSINDVFEVVNNMSETLTEVPNTYATIDALSEAKKELQEGSNILVDADGDYVMKR